MTNAISKITRTAADHQPYQGLLGDQVGDQRRSDGYARLEPFGHHHTGPALFGLDLLPKRHPAAFLLRDPSIEEDGYTAFVLGREFTNSKLLRTRGRLP